MAPVIWGLDLREIQFWKFKSSYMFSREYHLRREKMIIYQLAMIFCVISESVGTSAMDDYNKQQRYIQEIQPTSYVYNNDFIGIGSYNIFVGIAVATIFGAAFFFDLFWPTRHESPSVRLAWKISAIVVTIAALADAIALTIIVATRSIKVIGIPPDVIASVLAPYFHGLKPNPVYRHNSYCVGSVVLLWIGAAACVPSCIVLFKGHRYEDRMAHKEKGISSTVPEEKTAQ